MPELLCPYCGKPAQLVGGNIIYPHREDLYEKKFWNCAPCQAYVGCHPGTETPLGRLANAELRRAKMAAHAAFDPLWKEGGMSRKEAYAWLSQALNIPPDDCHMGMFDVNTCQRVIEACENRRNPLEPPKPIANPDWSKLIRVCQERVTEYVEGNTEDSDTPHYIYEESMTAVFGNDIWKWVNAIARRPR